MSGTKVPVLDPSIPTPHPEDDLRNFDYEHLVGALHPISKPFYNLAKFLVESLPRNRERLKALDKLLEAKDCAVRAALYKP